MAEPVADAADLYRQTCDFIAANVLPTLAWPELEICLDFWARGYQTVRNYIDILPVFTCMAAGGNYSRAIPLSAYWTLSMLAARILDDIQDGEGSDNPWYVRGILQALPSSACLLFAANLCLAHLDVRSATLREILGTLNTTAALAAKSQEASLGNSFTVEGYFQRIIASTGMAFAAVAWAGARLVTTDEVILNQVKEFGYNIGLRDAIHSDCLDLRPAEQKKGDLAAGLHTLPVIYGMSLSEHPYHAQLVSLYNHPSLTADQAEEAWSILQDMGAVAWCMRVAFEYNQRAAAAIATLPEERVQGLKCYVAS